MLGLIVSLVALSSVAAAQQTNFAIGTGIRSLWIPFKTIDGVPQASILAHDTVLNQTTYVISCPTAMPDCALAPNLTLTEGTDIAKWTSSTSGPATSGTVIINCPSLTNLASASITCHQGASAGDNIRTTTGVLGSTDISFQAVDVTATRNNTSTMPPTVTVTAADKSTSTSTSSTSTSTAGVQTAHAPWAVGGAVGAGLAALVAL